MFKILSDSTINGLEQKIAKYDISLLGSLVISNGHYFQSFVGTDKVAPKVTPKVTPKATAKKKPTTRKTTSKSSASKKEASKD